MNRMRRMMAVAVGGLYAVALAVCALVDLAGDGAFGWSGVVAAALLVAAALTMTPLVRRRSILATTALATWAAVLLLLGVVAAWTGGSWFPLAASSLVLAAVALGLPFGLRAVDPAGRFRHKAAVWLGAVTCLIVPVLWFSAAAAGAADLFGSVLLPALGFSLVLPAAILLCLRYLHARTAYRLAAASLCAAVFTAVSRPVYTALVEGLPLDRVMADPSLWLGGYAAGVGNLISAAALAVLALCLAVVGMVRGRAAHGQ